MIAPGKLVGGDVSVVLPAYNEAARLSPYLESLRSHLTALCNTGNYDVIVVDDGSTDGLATLLEELGRSLPDLSCMRLPSNQGKGAALRTGVAAARGDLILLADADGATAIEEEAKLRQAILDGADIAIGSRAAPGWDGLSSADDRGRRGGLPHVERTWHRRPAGALFAWLVRRMFGLPVRDTQCGFKMFRGEVARRLFALCKEDGYLIDVEVLLLAHRLGYKVVEVPVAWRDVPGSKVRLVRDGWRMLTGLWRLRRRMREFDFIAEEQRHREAIAN